ncbi:MAG: TetR/AcrR family transcriptional regulator C-terminal domain-containing protein [Nocardioides sp.]|nr:TetR/AcrR family transcriptional regulator C-terminal domain-containing protein [Nocardioides sp.]
MQLRRDDVLTGALEVLDGDGLEGITMRKLAAHLGVQAGGLYWHFANKQTLFEAMADKILEGVGAPVEPGPWDEQVGELARRLRRALLSHTDGARLVAGTYVTEKNTVAVGQVWFDVLRAAGIATDRVGWVGFSLSSYVLGHTIEEQGLAGSPPAVGSTGKAATSDAAESADVEAMISAVAAADPADRFEYGLSVFLDGLRYQMER